MYRNASMEVSVLKNVSQIRIKLSDWYLPRSRRAAHVKTKKKTSC